MEEKQEEILIFIKNYYRKNKYMPSIREIAREVGYKSPASVARKITSLEASGHLEKDPYVERGIRICDESFYKDCHN